MSNARLARVLVLGDPLGFQIAHEWIESAEQVDHYLYHLPNADSGWFPVSRITVRGEQKASRRHLLELLRQQANKGQGTFYEFGNNIVVA